LIYAAPNHTNRATRIPTAFDDPDFIWELKRDGFRARAYIEDGGCRLISRKQII